jgi:hypothetical protein
VGFIPIVVTFQRIEAKTTAKLTSTVWMYHSLSFSGDIRYYSIGLTPEKTKCLWTDMRVRFLFGFPIHRLHVWLFKLALQQ